MKAKLVVVKGAKPATIRINRLPATIGRCEEASLKLGTTAVSRKHCEIFLEDGRLVVRDLGSTNGTFINKAKVEKETVLANGDLLRVGPVTFQAICSEMPQPSTDDSFIDLDEPKDKAGAPASMSRVGYRDTPDGSFINIDEDEQAPAALAAGDDLPEPAERGAKKSDKDGPVKKKAVEEQPVAQEPHDQERPDSKVFNDLEEDEEGVSSDDSALNDFFKGLN